MSANKPIVAAVLSGLLWGTAVCAPPKVEFPTLPAPLPPPAPVDVTSLPEGKLYAFQTDDAVVVVASPDGVVRIDEEAGPFRVSGVFVGGSGKRETKKFTAKQIFIVERVQPGDVELLVIPVGVKLKTDVLRKTLTDPQSPRPPPPTPEPPAPKPPTPDPAVKPGEIPADGLHVLILYEVNPKTPMPARQQTIMDGITSRDWMEKNCVAGPDGRTKQYRIWPADTDGYADSRLWGDATKLRGATDPLPWLLISNGKKGGYRGALPADTEAFLRLAEKYR